MVGVVGLEMVWEGVGLGQVLLSQGGAWDGAAACPGVQGGRLPLLRATQEGMGSVCPWICVGLGCATLGAGQVMVLGGEVCGRTANFGWLQPLPCSSLPVQPLPSLRVAQPGPC